MEGEEMGEVEKLMEVLTRVELDLAYSSEKLVNLNGLLMQLSAQETENEAISGEKIDQTSLEFMEKALVFSLLSGVLESEVRELDSFMASLQAGIVEAKRDIASCRHLAEPYAMLEEKLCDSEESLKQTQYQSSELKIQSSKLQRTAQALSQGKREIEEVSLKGQSDTQIAGQRHILHMLEKSLARELDLEKKLADSRKSEDELKAKLNYAEQMVFQMEETSRGVWGRGLEPQDPDRMTSHDDLSSRFEQFQLNLNELKSKYERCTQELKLKDFALDTLRSGASLGHTSGDHQAELSGLREKLKESEFRLRSANSLNESSQARVTELENLVESLKESVEIAETRADSSELEVAELTGTNVELTEELNFLKSSVGALEKKVGVLEKQVRDSEIQLQHAKVSSEAGQEQQNMLYSAIWDMETLIEDLKSKVARAESKNESTEENCIMLSETNAELTREVGILRDRVDELEASLDQAESSKLECANQIKARTKLVMDMVVQLATERERIQIQLNTLTKENENFAKKLCLTVKEEQEEDYTRNSSCAQSSFETVKDSVGKSFELDETLNDGQHNSASVNTNINGTVSKHGDLNLKPVYLAIFVSLLSVTVLYYIN